MSNADAKISLKFGVGNVELNSFDGKINNLVYFENNKPLLELEGIDLEGNLTQGYAAISSVTKIEPRINSYSDVKVEFSSNGNIEDKKEITLSFRSKLSGLISLVPKIKTDLTWLNSFARSQGEKELSFTYSKAIEFKEIEKFFSPEENMFELNIDDLLIPVSAQNSINLAALNLKGVGNTIFFDVVMATNNRKITGSINNWLSNIYSKEKASSLIVVFDNLNSKTLFPEFSTFNVNGPLKLTFLLQKKTIIFYFEAELTSQKQMFMSQPLL